jgi:hypothetical protein
MGVSAVQWSVREARSRRSWIYFSWDKKNLSCVEEISISRKYRRGPRSDIRNGSTNPVTIVGAVEEHQTSQHWDMTWRSWRRNHDDGESRRAAAAARTLIVFFENPTVLGGAGRGD